MGQNADIML